MAFLKFFDSNSCHSSDGFKVYNLPIWCKYWWRCSARASFHVTRSPLVVTRFADVAPENKATLVTSTTLKMYLGKQTFRINFVKLLCLKNKNCRKSYSLLINRFLTGGTWTIKGSLERALGSSEVTIVKQYYSFGCAKYIKGLQRPF